MKMSQQAGSNPGPQDHKSDALTAQFYLNDLYVRAACNGQNSKE